MTWTVLCRPGWRDAPESGEYTTKATVEKVDKNAAVKRGIPLIPLCAGQPGSGIGPAEMNTLNNVK